jgi:hypothetical protein
VKLFGGEVDEKWCREHIKVSKFALGVEVLY